MTRHGWLTARRLGLRPCPACRLVSASQTSRCPRCQTPLHRRRIDSLTRSWAFLIAAAILYVPANVLPVMQTGTLMETRYDTIFSGVAVLWRSGDWDLALIVFVASVVVPLVKILSLAFLLLCVQLRAVGHVRARTRLFRVLDFVGHWSMLDIFVVSLLAALVQFHPYAQVRPQPGAIAFGAVVVLTMLATMSFDPRLMWDVLPEDSDE